MLGFRINYLRGVVQAADVSAGQKKDVVEWPPHPDRLFSALVQAWGDLGEPNDAREALCLLEQAGPPWIHAADLLSVSALPRYVPVNDSLEGGSQIQGTGLCRDRKARLFPYSSLEVPVAIIQWPDFNPSTETRLALERLAAQISHLGHSSSMVQVELLDSLVEGLSTWRPDPDGDRPIRVPYPGRLDELIAAYRKRKKSPSWPPVGLHVSYARAERKVSHSCGTHGEMIPFRLRYRGAPLPLEAASTVLGVWRKALIKEASQPVPEVLSGHAPDSTPEQPKPSPRPHLALVPLPDVGHRFAVGHLLGVAAVLPRDISTAERNECLVALEAVKHLTMGDLGVVELVPLDAFETRKALQPVTWTRPSRVWASVTPVVLGKFPRQLFSDESCRIVEEACQIAGLPNPARIDIAVVPWILGSVPSARFPALPARPGKPRRAHIHVRLEFDNPIRGPVLVGAGRHLGYGIFRQLEDRR